MGIGTSELILILVVVMIIFGAGKLPETGAALGKGIRSFKKALNEPETLEISSSEKAKEPKGARAKDPEEFPS
jgi:sec-independent protein translocase protein TatA